MPVYEFECSHCGQDFERLEGMIQDETPLRECPRCGSQDVQKLVSRLHFKPEARFEDWSPAEQRLALENKAYIESRRDDLLSGAMKIESTKGVPKECQPNL